MVDQILLDLSQKILDLDHQKTRGLCKLKIEEFTMGLLSILFPQRGLKQEIGLKELCGLLEEKRIILREMLEYLKIDNADKLTDRFFQFLPLLKEKLKEDARFIFKEDPAANCLEEVILCYPGFLALGVYRLANFFFHSGVSLLPRVMTELAHEKTGIDIHPGAELGCPLFIDHGTGIVIGETSKVGNYTKIYQGVTLGALSVHKDEKDKARHPTIEEHCIIYSNSTILGGKTIVGHHSTIGGNVWLTESIPPYSLIFHDRGKLKRRLKNYNENI